MSRALFSVIIGIALASSALAHDDAPLDLSRAAMQPPFTGGFGERAGLVVWGTNASDFHGYNTTFPAARAANDINFAGGPAAGVIGNVNLTGSYFAVVTPANATNTMCDVRVTTYITFGGWVDGTFPGSNVTGQGTLANFVGTPGFINFFDPSTCVPMTLGAMPNTAGTDGMFMVEVFVPGTTTLHPTSWTPSTLGTSLNVGSSDTQRWGDSTGPGGIGGPDGLVQPLNGTAALEVNFANVPGGRAIYGGLWATLSCVPDNDDCANALPVLCNSTTPFDNTCATTDNASSCGVESNNVWYRFTNTSGVSMVVTFDTCGSQFDTILSVNDVCGSTSLACNDDFCGFQSQVTMTLAPGQTVWISIGGYSGDTGLGQLTVTCCNVPVNDYCLGASLVSEGMYQFDNTCATDDGFESCSVGGPINSGADVWFRYAPSGNGIAAFETTVGGTISDTVLSVQFGGCFVSEYACDDDSGVGLLSRICGIAVNTDQTYFIRVAGWNAAAPSRGTGNLVITLNDAGPAFSPPDGALNEPGLCTDLPANDLNGGCTFAPSPRYTSINLCDPYIGTAWVDASGSTRDTDWYQFSLPSADTVTVTGQTQFGAFTAILDSNDCNAVVALASAFPDPGCGEVANFSYSATLPAGTYAIFMAPQFGTGMPCSLEKQYWFRCSVSEVPFVAPLGALFEPGLCADYPPTDLNGGCNVSPNRFTNLNLCDTYVGTGSALLPNANGFRDTDWYEFSLATSDTVTFTGETEFLGFSAILDNNCPPAIFATAFPDPGCNGIGSFSMSIPLPAGLYRFFIAPQFSAGNSCGDDDRYWFHVEASRDCNGNGVPDSCELIGPVILSTSGDTSVCLDSKARFSVTATGFGALSYQWQTGNPLGVWSNLSDGTVNGVGIVDGSGTMELSISNFESNASIYRYRCLVSDNCASTASDPPMVLDVSPDTTVTITEQPANAYSCSDGKARFTVAASSTGPLTYRWQYEHPTGWLALSDGVVDGIGTIEGADTSELSIRDFGNNASVSGYRCVVSNDCSSVTSDPASLSGILDQPVSITAPPEDFIACEQDTATFSVAASGTSPLSYQWQHENPTDTWTDLADGAGSGVGTVSGATAASLSISGFTPASPGKYRCIVSNECGDVTSGFATLTVNTAPTVSSPDSLSVCVGENAEFSVTATGTPTPTLKWQKNGVDIPGATSLTYSITSVASSDAGSYNCIAHNICGDATSTTAHLTAKPLPTISGHPASLTRCAGESATFTATATGTPPLTYQWRMGGVEIDGATSPTFTIFSVLPEDAENYDCIVTSDGCSVVCNAAHLDVTVVPNDECIGANASPYLLTGGTHTVNTRCSTTTTNAPNPPFPMYNDVWYRYCTPSDCAGTVRISTCNSPSGIDSALAVYSGPCGSLSLIASNDNATTQSCSGTLLSATSFIAAAGQCYYIRVGSSSSAVRYEGRINIVDPHPVSEQCANGTGTNKGQRYFQVLGQTAGTNWGWCLTSCCANKWVMNVPGVPVIPGESLEASQNRLADKFVESINMACANSPSFLADRIIAVNSISVGAGVFKVKIVCPSPPLLVYPFFTFSVGSPGSSCENQCIVQGFEAFPGTTPPVYNNPIPTSGPCSFNPPIVDLPTTGQDCNLNDIDDYVDIYVGNSLDLNSDFVPDECQGLVCDSIDFNNDTSYFDPQDIEAFLSVYSEGPCIPSFAACNDIDFNNDGSFFDPCDIDAYLLAYSEGPCTPCGF